MDISSNKFDTDEGFRMRGKASKAATGSGATAGAATGAVAGGATGAGLGALAAGGTAATMSSSGNVAQCPVTDESFYCQMSRVTNMVSMLLFIIIALSSLIYLFYFLYTLTFSGKGTKTSGR